MEILEQLKIMNVYVPPAIGRMAVRNPHYQPGGTWRRFHAATLFADISGFTPLAESLAERGIRGAEELTSVLNEVFEALITAAEAHGGQVVKFGGDALSIIWPCEPEYMADASWRAIQAAFAMQVSMARFFTVTAGEKQFQMRMKIGISVGEVLEVHAGGVYNRWEYVLAGTPMANMSEAENHARAGEIVVDQPVWNLVSGLEPHEDNWDRVNNSNIYVLGEQAAPGFYRIIELRGGIPPRALMRPDWSRLDEVSAAKVAAILRDYIPGAIKSVLESGHRDLLAELKPMTVCFLGFDGINYDGGLEAGSRLSNFMRDCQEMIYHYEGSVNKLAVGDKGSVLLVLFGAPPFFHEDDEVRAVACALSLLKVAARHHLTVRIGLAAGTVFAGPLGAPQRREYSVIGDTVNLAARLMQKAASGEVWVDASVQSKSARFFEYQNLGLISVKGKAEPREVFVALNEKEPDQDELVMSYLLSNQELTGRDKELAYIDTLADKVWQGKGQVLLLSGEAGVGKSRLAAEIVRRWMARGGVSHGGDCVSYGGKTPYLPWRGVLSSLAGLSNRLPATERAARLERILLSLPIPAGQLRDDPANKNYWVERLPLLADILGLEVKASALTQNLAEDLRRDNVFAAIRAIALQQAQQRPTLLLLEDTHWSDELSLELAAYLAADIANHPLFLVLVHRPLGEPKPLPYQRLGNLPYTASLYVDELGLEASLKLVQRKIGVKALPQQLADLIAQKGQGNPFFIEELVNSLLSLGAIKIENGVCLVQGNLDELEMPDTVQKVVLARIDQLNEADKVTLKVAAAIGRTFQRDLLVAVHPWINTEATLNEQLARLQAEDFTRQEQTDNTNLDFLFKHVITQEVAYETLLYSQRRQLHATIGATLEERYLNNDSEIVDLLAYHYARSNERNKALFYQQRAGQKALIGYANEAAIGYFSEAITLAEELNLSNARFELLAGREKAYNRLGNRSAQAEDLAQMKQLALEDGNLGQQLETANRQIQLATDLGQYDQAIDIAEEALLLSRKGALPGWEATTLSNLGIAYWRQGDYDRALQAMEQSLALKQLARDTQLQATNLNYLGLIYNRTAEYQKSRQAYREAMQLYRDIGDRGGEAGCANNLGLLESSLGRYKEAQKYYRQALSICHTIGDRPREGISLNTLGQVLTILGDFGQAEEHLQHSLNIRQAIGDRRGEAFCLHDMGSLYLAQQQADKAAEHFSQAAKLRQTLGETGNYIASLSAWGSALLALSQAESAYAYLSQAVEHLQNNASSGEYPPQNIWWAYAQVCLALNKQAEANQALQTAYHLVQSKASRIADTDLRQSYLQNVGINAAIIAQSPRIDTGLVR